MVISVQKRKELSKNHWLSVQENAEDAVVQIFSVAGIFNWTQPFKPATQLTFSGSGFIINENGYFITNSHVVDQAKSVWIQIPALGRQNLDADIISVCPDRDIALLKIRKEGLEQINLILGRVPYLSLGDSDSINRTNEILVLGYPLGQHYLKATRGIVSGREHIENELYIQIDAAINLGSSGGPVLNEKSEVIGITTAMISAAHGIGFIIPIHELKTIIDDLHSAPFLRKQALGIGFNNSTHEQVLFLKNPLPGGLYVNKVFKDSIAERAGIKSGDMIYKLNGHELDIYGDTHVPWSRDKISFADIISRFKNGQEISLVLYRNGEKKEINFKFEDAPIYPIRTFYPEYEKIDYEIIGGLVVMELTENQIPELFPFAPDLIKYELTENQTEPVLIISHIFPGSEIFRLRILAPGNIIKNVNGIDVNTIDNFRQALKNGLTSGFLTIKTERDVFVVLNLFQVLRDEYRLAQDYKYNLSPAVSYLLKVIEASQYINQ